MCGVVAILSREGINNYHINIAKKAFIKIGFGEYFIF